MKRRPRAGRLSRALLWLLSGPERDDRPFLGRNVSDAELGWTDPRRIVEDDEVGDRRLRRRADERRGDHQRRRPPARGQGNGG